VLADRDETVGSQVAALLRDKGFEAEFVACDVSNEAAVNAMIGVARGSAVKKLTRWSTWLDIIAKLHETDLERWNRCL
jgi:hypothetical protein